MNHLPPEPRDAPSTVAAHFMSKVFSEETELLQAACKYAAVELSAQPQLRNMMKNQLREHGTISVVLTE
jgi:transcriptional accessory protein Tex/SPT6